jgi:hypothetical protein
MNNSRGSSYFTVLIVLLLISVLFIGVSTFAHMVARTSVVISERQEVKQELIKEAERVVDLLCKEVSDSSDSPEADSPHDNVWKEIFFCEIPEAKITLEDISSRLNPNWMMRTLFSKTEFTNLLNSDTSPDDLQAYREKQGLSVDINPHYLDFFSEENMEKYFTGYSYFNINLTDEFVLAQVFRQRTGKSESEAENFRVRVQQRRLAEDPLKRLVLNKDLEQFLKQDFGRLYPVINAHPLFNVNFIDKEILEEIINYPYPDQGKNKHISPALTSWIIEQREQRELTEKDLKNTIKPRYEKARIGQFLGAHTWFWRITITKQSAVLVWIVARVPQSTENAADIENQSANGIYYMLVQERFSE